jgi:hypothetical protein
MFGVKPAHSIFAGPVSGSDADPAFRALVAGDIPDLSSIYVPVTRQINTGTGLSGGGALSSDLTLAVTGNLATLFSLADGAGWLHNDGAGVLAYSTPTPSDIGLSAGNSITLTGGVIDTIQDIRTSAVPSFAGIIISTNNVMIPGGTITGLTQLGIATGAYANIQNLNESSIDGLSYVSVNYTGYLNGTTQPRGLRVYDGKTNLISQTDSSGLTIIPSTASTSPTTGALVVAGGVGVGGDINIGGNMNVSGIVKMPGMPTSSSGLASGTLWNDSGTVKIA